MPKSHDDDTPIEPHYDGRVSVPSLDEVLGRPWRILDDGFVRVVDYLGGDASVVQAARVSYGAGTKRIHEDRGLIRYLLRHRHTTPFEMCEIKLHVRVPMDTWRQWIRHRTANVNEYSTRYSVAIDRAQTTRPTDWRRQASTNRQGSAGLLDPAVGEQLSSDEEELQAQSRQVYKHRLTVGVAREQARKDLPLSTYTEAYWKIDLWNLLHFLGLRMDAHAQEEIRTYAHVIGHEIVSRWVPITWQAFLDYQVNAERFSALELAVLRPLVAGDMNAAKQVATELGWLKRGTTGELAIHRERDEFVEKASRSLSLKIDWER